MDRLLLEVSPLGSRTAYSYNAQGLPCRTQNARGQESTCTYDALGRVTSVTDALGTVTYTYDKNGNLLTVTDKNGTITRQYDALNRVTQYTDCRGNRVSYAYDELGNLLSLTYPGGETVRYTYYPNGLLHTVEDPEGGTTSYTYDKNGRLTRTLRPNGTEETRTYDREGRLTGLKDIRTADGEILAGYTYAYDGRGNLTRITGLMAAESTANLGSAGSTAAITGGVGRLSGAVHTPAAEPAAVPAGTALAGTANFGSVLTSAEMTYGPDNRMLTYNGEALRYDADGNMTYGPVDGVMTQLSYDCRNRLVQAGGTTYAYDAEDNRIRMETADATEEYVTDTVSASLSRVLVVTVTPKEGAGEQTLCVYGQGLISEHREGTALYHHYNHLGSTVKLTDESGETAAAYAYGPYGELLSGSPALSRYLYNGRLGVTTDGNGLYYMRQRYYNPETKRFVNQDILRGNPADSRSLNRYSYVQGNPVSYTDPFGLSPLGAMFEGTGFVHGLFGLLGMVPGPVGIAANLADSLVYAVVDKDMLMAGCSFLNALSMGTTSYLNACIKANRGVRMAGAINNVVTMASNTMNFAQCSNDMMAASFAMYDKYVIRGEAFTAATFWEVAGLGLSAAGCVGSGASLRGNIIQTAALVNKPGGYPRINSNMADAVPQAGSSSRNPVQKGSLQQTPAGTGGVILVFDINLSPSSGSISAAQLADGACFTAGTQVLTDSGHKAIEEIHAGDRVLAENPETGEQGYREVLRTYVRQQEVIVHVILGQTEIETTREHPFYVEGTGFVEASRLKAGDPVRTADGSSLAVSAVETEYLAEPVSVYNLEVEGWHTYYVSDSGVLVHNMCAMSVKSGSNTNWEAHNVVNYAKLKEQYRVSELANDVVDSITQTGSLPSNYITKSQARAMGWSEGKALNNYAPGMALGGDVFANPNGVLPNANGRIWYEADVGVDYTMRRSNPKNPAYRILYSNDGLIYGTYDHYDTVFQIFP